MSPPASTNSFLKNIEGSRALAVRSSSRCRCSPKIIPSPGTIRALARSSTIAWKAGSKSSGPPHLGRNQLRVQGSGRPFDLFEYRAGGREARIPQDAQTLAVRNGRYQNFHLLACELAGQKAHPGEVPARPRQRRDEAVANGIADPGEDDRYRRGRALSRPCRSCAYDDDDVRLNANQVGGKARQDLVFPLGVTMLEGEVLAFDPAE